MKFQIGFRRVCSVALIVLGSVAQHSNAQALSTGTITDPTLGNIKSHTVSIPAGWQFQGTVVRGPDCYPNSFRHSAPTLATASLKSASFPPSTGVFTPPFA